MKNIWKYSKLRFYIKNFLWNFNFWLLSKKEFENITYFKKNFFNLQKDKITKRRFKGYSYRNNTYIDNPGIPNIERDVWEAWKNKGLLK